MRVLTVGSMYPPHSLGGYELMWRGAVGYLRDRGHQVRVLTTDYRAPAPDPAIPEDPEVHRELRWYWREHGFPRLGLKERLAVERHNAAVLKRHLTDFAPTVVSWWAMGGMSLSLIERVRRLRVPAVGVVVDDWMVYAPLVDQWQRAMRRLGPLSRLAGAMAGVPARLDLGRAASWIFVSETVRRHAVEAGWTVPNTAIAHGGVDLTLFPEAPQSDWRWRLLYVGRIDSRKGIETAMRALAELPEATLSVIGSGDDSHLARLQGLVATLGLDGRVTFAQRPRDELAGAYAAADAVLFPVLWEEPWGLVPLESMAVGTVVVATGAGGSGEYLRDGENCLIFEPRDDPGALARAVQGLARDQALRARLRDGGLETAARFDERSFNAAVGEKLESVSR